MIQQIVHERTAGRAVLGEIGVREGGIARVISSATLVAGAGRFCDGIKLIGMDT